MSNAPQCTRAAGCFSTHAQQVLHHKQAGRSYSILAMPKASQPPAPMHSRSPGTKVLCIALTEHAVLVFHCT